MLSRVNCCRVSSPLLRNNRQTAAEVRLLQLCSKGLIPAQPAQNKNAAAAAAAAGAGAPAAAGSAGGPAAAAAAAACCALKEVR